MPKKWNRHELLIAFGLYHQMPFGQLHRRNPEIIRVAELIDRSPDALAMKLTNIASLDPGILASGRKGLPNASSADEKMWTEMKADWGGFFSEVAQAMESVGEGVAPDPDIESDYSGGTRLVTREERIGHSLFRRSILSAYNHRCCISGLSVPRLLTSGHIRPWALDVANRLNPSNGLCLSVIHHKAFDTGIISIREDMKVMVSRVSVPSDDFFEHAITSFEGKKITLPEKFWPDKDFLAYHRENIFLG